MSLDFIDDKSTLVQVMAWCRQATSHYLTQCWPRYLLPYGVNRPQWVNSSPPGQNGRHFADDTFKRNLLNKMFFFLSIRFSLKFVPNGPMDNKAALVQVIACRRTGDKSLPKPMLTQFIDTYKRHWGRCVKDSPVPTRTNRFPCKWTRKMLNVHIKCMMTSSNGNTFRVTDHLCGEFTGHRWIPRTKASDAELWCFLWSPPEYTVA